MSDAELKTFQRQLNIKSGAALRLLKDHQSYQKEEETNKKRLDKFIADGAEDWDIKNAGKVLTETQNMIKHSASSLGKTTQELRDMIVAAEKNPAFAEDESLKKAKDTWEIVSI